MFICWWQLNGSGQEPRHFDWNFQVCQNPPKLRKPTCVMWKDVPVLSFPRSRKKRLDRPKVLSSQILPVGVQFISLRLWRRWKFAQQNRLWRPLCTNPGNEWPEYHLYIYWLVCSSIFSSFGPIQMTLSGFERGWLETGVSSLPFFLTGDNHPGKFCRNDPQAAQLNTRHS